MRPTFSSTISVLSLSLLTLLSACGGGGGDSGDELKPVILPTGTLELSNNTAVAGKYVVDTGDSAAELDTVSTPDDSVVVTLEGDPDFGITLIYNVATGAVNGLVLNIVPAAPATAQLFGCADASVRTDPSTPACTASALALDKTARTLKMTNFVVPSASGGASVTINGTVTWPVPTP